MPRRTRKTIRLNSEASFTALTTSLSSLLGRYEYTDEKSNKFWECVYESELGTYTTSWGRIGSRGQSKVGLTGKEALKKIQEKIAKGYIVHAQGDRLDNKNTDQMQATRRMKEKRKDREEINEFMEELRKIK